MPTESVTESVVEMVRASRSVQKAWANQSLGERVGIIRRVRVELYQRRADAAAVISRETGKPLPEAMIAEVAMVLDADSEQHSNFDETDSRYLQQIVKLTEGMLK